MNFVKELKQYMDFNYFCDITDDIVMFLYSYATAVKIAPVRYCFGTMDATTVQKLGDRVGRAAVGSEVYGERQA
jgi:hypothetical protein